MAKGPQQPAASHARSAVGSIKDMIESLVIAFILAFAFRAFVLEAFVIPTGSMAATLYGAQVTNTCSNCGYEYARGISEEEVFAAARGRMNTVEFRCPNCDTMVDNLSAAQICRPDSGDRILVLKWAYDLGLKELGPQRWDVTVFKNPSNGRDNYIKRLIGMPGEILEIIDGDIYTAPIEELKQKEPGLVEALDALRYEVARHRNPSLRPDSTGRGNPYERPDLMSEYERLNKRLLPYLKVQRKTSQAQESLWINVYNHDFCPAGISSGRPLSHVRWTPIGDAAAKAWDTSHREVTFASDSDAPLAIQFDGKPIRDFVTYNYNGAMPISQSDEGANPVGDLRLRFAWIPDDGDGGIDAQMNRDLDTFVAQIQRDGTVGLDHLRTDLPGGRQQIGQVKLPQPFTNGQAVEVEMTNVDCRVSLSIDGVEILASNAQQYSPNLSHRLQNSHDPARMVQPSIVQIAAHNLRCRLRHLTLERDEYYRSVAQNEKTSLGQTNPYLGWPCWGTAGCPILLRSDRDIDGHHYYGEFFMLGDNSPASKDSRRWWEIGAHLAFLGDEYQLGTVPRDQLIGRAFFVYWPAGYRAAWAGNLGLIPNVGRMRWIR